MLVVDEDTLFARAFHSSLDAGGILCAWAQSAQEALYLARHTPGITLAFIDSEISGSGGLALLQQLRQLDPNLTVILMSSRGTMVAAMEAAKRGAADYILKPFDLMAMAEKVGRYQELYRDGCKSLDSPAMGPIRNLEDFIFRSPAMQQVVKMARDASQTDVPVLLVGERGVGKDMLARAIQSASPRAGRPFLRIDCSSEHADPNLRDPAFSETGMRRLFDATANGTLLLSEVGDLPADTQNSLVKFLSGANTSGPDGTLGPRIIASSSHPVDELRTSRLRPDLFSAVAGVILEIPPLRERPEDIAPLIRYFLGRLGQRYNHDFALSWSGLDLLSRYEFRGNVRELECLLERVAARSLQSPRRVTYGELLPHMDESGMPPRKIVLEDQPLNLNRVEQLAIERALWFAKGNRTKAAALLGIDRTTLHSKLRRFNKEAHPN